MSDITLTLNHAQSEKLNQAWSRFKTAHGMAFSQNQGGVYFDASLPDYLWQEPNTGIIIIKPGFFTAKRFDPTIALRTWIKPSDIDYRGTSQGGTLFSYFGSTGNDTSFSADYQVSSPTLVSSTDIRESVIVPPGLMGFIARTVYSDQNMVWNAQTTIQLEANQAFAVMIFPSGIPGDFAHTFFMIAWGQKFVMEITMSGFAYLWGDIDGNGLYVPIDTYVLRDGGVNMTNPFQVSVVPLGRRFLSVSFTQNPLTGRSKRVSTYSSQTESFITVLQGQGPLATDNNNLEPVWDASLNQWVKYPAAKLSIGLKADDFDYHFIMAKGYFPAPQTIFMAKEYPPAKPTWNGSVGIDHYLLSIEGQTEASGGTPASTSVVLYNQNGTPYLASSGQALVSAVTLNPSQNGVYSPECHAYGVSYPANVHTPDWNPIDASADWVLIRFILSTDLSAQRVEIKLNRDSVADYLDLLKQPGPCRVKALNNDGDEVVLCDFYPSRDQPTAEGPSQITTDQLEGLDMWDRLDSTPCLLQSVVEGEIVAEKFAEAIKSCGFLDSEVFVDYASSPEMAGITFAKFTNPNDLLRPNTDTSVGDFIRNVASKLGVQFSPPFRVRWVSNGIGGMYWRIYIGPIYGDRTDFQHGKVQHRFFLDNSLIPWDDYSTEAERYQGHDFLIVGKEELTVQRPDFNAILASAAKGVDGKQGTEVRYIPPPSRVLTDPSYIGFEGAERVKQLGTEDLQIAETAASVEQVARQYYEQHYNLKRLRFFESSVEWQPEVAVDEFFVVIGKAKFDDPDGRYLAGAPVSYGAYRFEHIDVEIRHDFTLPSSSSSRWEWAGSVTGGYVGPYEDADFQVGGIPAPLKMWTTPNRLPDNYDLPPGFTP